jgi:hypothetical protein
MHPNTTIALQTLTKRAPQLGSSEDCRRSDDDSCGAGRSSPWDRRCGRHILRTDPPPKCGGKQCFQNLHVKTTTNKTRGAPFLAVMLRLLPLGRRAGPGFERNPQYAGTGALHLAG